MSSWHLPCAYIYALVSKYSYLQCDACIFTPAWLCVYFCSFHGVCILKLSWSCFDESSFPYLQLHIYLIIPPIPNFSSEDSFTSQEIAFLLLGYIIKWPPVIFEATDFVLMTSAVSNYPPIPNVSLVGRPSAPPIGNIHTDIHTHRLTVLYIYNRKYSALLG